MLTIEADRDKKPKKKYENAFENCVNPEKFGTDRLLQALLKLWSDKPITESDLEIIQTTFWDSETDEVRHIYDRLREKIANIIERNYELDLNGLSSHSELQEIDRKKSYCEQRLRRYIIHTMTKVSQIQRRSLKILSESNKKIGNILSPNIQ